MVPCASHAGAFEQRSNLLLGKTFPYVSHLVLQIVAIVRHHVDDQKATTGLESSARLGDRLPRLWNVVQREKEKRCIE